MQNVMKTRLKYLRKTRIPRRAWYSGLTFSTWVSMAIPFSGSLCMGFMLFVLGALTVALLMIPPPFPS